MFALVELNGGTEVVQVRGRDGASVVAECLQIEEEEPLGVGGRARVCRLLGEKFGMGDEPALVLEQQQGSWLRRDPLALEVEAPCGGAVGRWGESVGKSEVKKCLMLCPGDR